MRRAPLHVPVGAARAQPELTADQAAALRAIVTAAPGERLLLHGVTGSGKTEVYLHAAAAVLAAGRGVIVLVPEIALTPQIVARFVARFGDTVAVLHSELSAGERYDEWPRLRAGEARVCVGPRSAVFAPMRDVGLVVVDEEHDASYKHEGDPRYDARRVAERRAAQAGAVLVAGSATPRPESVHALRAPAPAAARRRRAAAAGRDRRHARGAARAAPADPRGAGRRAQGDRPAQPPRLVELPHLPLVRARVGVPVVRRHARPAPRRRAAGLPPLRPPRAGARALRRLRLGLDRAPRRGHRAPGGRARADTVFRLDAEVADPARVLARFEQAPRGVLVGTQMVAKGHDFPDVELGVVLDADATLRFPDFRAEERTFALVAQLAGRAGRGARGGRVLVQTLAPDAPSIRLAARHDADGFLAGELERRRALRYPPFSTLIRVVCSSPEPGAALAAAAAVARAPRPTPSGRRRCSACAGASAPRSWSRRRTARAAVAAVGAAVQAAVGDRAHRGVRVQRRRRPAVASPCSGKWQSRIWQSTTSTSWRTRRPTRPSRRRSIRRSPRAARRRCARAQLRRSGAEGQALPVERFDDALRAEVARMGALMHDALGIGLAATQVGVLHRVLVYRVEHDSPVDALVNPVLEWSGGDEETLEEGCLSLPGVLVDVERPIHVRVRAQDEHGEAILIEASGLEARVIQHEMDHLDGVLILDRTSRDQRKEAMRILRERRRGRLSTVFLGTSDFAAAVLDAWRPPTTARRSSSRAPTAPRGAGASSAPPPVADAARALGLEVVQPESVNTAEAARADRRRRRRRARASARSAR